MNFDLFMGNHCVTSRLKFMNRRSLLFFSLSIFFFFFLLAFLNTSPSKTSCLVFRCQMDDGKADFLSQKTLEKSTENDENKVEVVMPMSLATKVKRRILMGLGSSPPRCNWKCGRCTPCRPVHVPVPPGVPVTTEYYPEAWRCKCGNRLYIP